MGRKKYSPEWQMEKIESPEQDICRKKFSAIFYRYNIKYIAIYYSSILLLLIASLLSLSAENFISIHNLDI